MEWKQLLSEKRERMTHSGAKNTLDLRSQFEKDYHRIIGSASFRRLQDKTQVFPLDKSDFIRTRLTHSLEVSSFAKSLGQNIGEQILTQKKDTAFTTQMKEDISNILQCAGLIHDIGNPPFGHFGEVVIREWFQNNLPELKLGGKSLDQILEPQMREDLYHFEGNAQALRLVTKLHYLVDEKGMNLTYALLGTIMKYPVSSLEIEPKGDIRKKKPGYYLADKEIFDEVQRETGTFGRRHPLTFVLEAADDIAYLTADIEDAFVKGFIPYRVLCEEMQKMEHKTGEFDVLELLRRYHEKGIERNELNPEEYAVKNWIVRIQSFLIGCATKGFMEHYEEIMAGSWDKDLFYGTDAQELAAHLGEMAHRIVFSSPQIYKLEVTEYVILNSLLNQFMGALVKYDVEGERLTSIEERLISFISDNYVKLYKMQSEGKGESERLYLRLLLGTDYICGMTDSYAKRFYQELAVMI